MKHAAEAVQQSEKATANAELPRTSLVKAEAIERSLLSCLFQDEGAFSRVLDVVTEASFFDPAHQIIFHAISQQAMAQKPIDVMSILSMLETRGQDTSMGGFDYLNRLLGEPVDIFAARNYAEQVAERFMRRRLAELGKAITSSAIEPNGLSGVELLSGADKLMAEVSGSALRATGALGASQIMADVLDRLQRAADLGKEVTGTATGYPEIDRMTRGLQPGELVILAARPSMGKTALAINIVEHVALAGPSQNVLVFSCEMSSVSLMQRSVASLGRIDGQRLLNGQLLDDEWSRLSEAADRYSSVGARDTLWIDESSHTLDQIRAGARAQKKKLGSLSLIVIDYLQLLSSGGRRSDNRTNEVSEISRGLKLLAKELECPVLALSQLSRAVEARTDKRPMMSDLRESGAIEQDADVVMFIYRDDYYNREASKSPGTAEIIFAKQRSGPVGTVKLAFNRESTRFEPLSA